MNAPEKKLLLLIGGVLVLGLVAYGMKVVLVNPLRKIDKQTAGFRDKIEKIQGERSAYFSAEQVVKGFAQRTFSDQIGQASAKSGEMLTKQILLSGLREGDFSRLPYGPVKQRYAVELGWNVQGQGKLVDVIDLLFLLQQSPYLHRIENLNLSQGDAGGQVRVGFRFLTLVLDPAPVIEAVPLKAGLALESPERKLLDGIVGRDLLRPYIKRAPDKSGTPEHPSAPSGPSALRIVSLSEWMGQPEVHVRDLSTQKTQRYKLGDELAGGTIVMVDYRALPMPGNEGLKSFSRVILRIGNEYWAVERGRTLADKWRLPPEQRPNQLTKF